MNVHFGIDIGATFVKYGAINSEGHIEYSARTPTKGEDGAQKAVDVIVNCARTLMQWAENAGQTATSIGVGSPGTIHPATNSVQPPSPNIPEIVGVNFVELLGRDTGLPAVIDNDANCAAWAEYRFGAGRGIDNLILLTVGSGLGSGFILDGRLLHGPSGSAAELGHVSIAWDGPVCPCGNRGCLENYTSATALLKRAEEAACLDQEGPLNQSRDPESGKITIRGLFGVAHAGDSTAMSVLDDAAQKLAVGILTAVNIVDPEAVIIGGGVADADFALGGRWLKSIGDYLHQSAFSEAGRHLQIGRAVLGNDAGFIGAAALGADSNSR